MFSLLRASIASPLPLLDLGGASRRTAGAVTERSEAQREALADLDSHAAGATMIEVHGGRASACQLSGV
jgi:hypothetical protein